MFFEWMEDGECWWWCGGGKGGDGDSDPGLEDPPDSTAVPACDLGISDAEESLAPTTKLGWTLAAASGGRREQQEDLCAPWR